jgi:hypothetical protein
VFPTYLKRELRSRAPGSFGFSGHAGSGSHPPVGCASTRLGALWRAGAVRQWCDRAGRAGRVVDAPAVVAATIACGGITIAAAGLWLAVRAARVSPTEAVWSMRCGIPSVRIYLAATDDRISAATA